MVLPVGFEELLVSGCDKKMYSQAHILEMPLGCPLHVASVAVELTEGCRPPSNALQRRVAIGKAVTKKKAVFKALAEAAERHALQYSLSRGKRIDAFFSSDGLPLTVNQEDITLGSPSELVIRSIGSAAGVSLEDAAMRAVLEILEHIQVRKFWEGNLDLSCIKCDAVPELSIFTDWLHSQLRTLSLCLNWFKPGYWVALAACSDFDGHRRTEGSAAGLDQISTILTAVEEAIFHWRNMVALENRGIDLSIMTSIEREALERYRGAVSRIGWPEATRARKFRDGNRLANLAELIDAAGQVCGQTVSLFDLTEPTLGVPVVRGYFGLCASQNVDS